jgi:hypothetical protein
MGSDNSSMVTKKKREIIINKEQHKIDMKIKENKKLYDFVKKPLDSTLPYITSTVSFVSTSDVVRSYGVKNFTHAAINNNHLKNFVTTAPQVSYLRTLNHVDSCMKSDNVSSYSSVRPMTEIAFDPLPFTTFH